MFKALLCSIAHCLNAKTEFGKREKPEKKFYSVMMTELRIELGIS